jgi:hypothetical protein
MGAVTTAIERSPRCLHPLSPTPVPSPAPPDPPPPPPLPPPPAPDTLAHKAERLSDADLDAALASALSGDLDAAELRLARVNPPCILHPLKPRPKTHRLPGHHYTRRGAGLQAKKVSPWRR